LSLYRLPPDFDRWTTPHPTRAELEGRDGKGLASPLAGLELFWLRDRLEAFLVHVQGSARLELPDGAIASVGYAGKTDRPYTSIGMELVRDGILERSGLTLPAVLAYLRATPTALEQYLPRNESFIFFRETGGSPPTGSLGVPVTGDRSIATDKSLMPPGALAFIQVPLPYADGNGGMAFRPTHRFVLDQDTGSAIRGAGRVDVFLGTGAEAGVSHWGYSIALGH
ncbi:MAG: murein transglycosylase, partial [Coleofasciculaceae cyanobacterium SM2_3_26]|nr:murein transglycosylase [Coleofasciculaceae cyanobacterium SM2_3_26]